MSFKAALRRVLLLGFLAVAAMTGSQMTHEEIERLMNAMHRVEVVETVKKDRDGVT